MRGDSDNEADELDMLIANAKIVTAGVESSSDSSSENEPVEESDEEPEAPAEPLAAVAVTAPNVGMPGPEVTPVFGAAAEFKEHKVRKHRPQKESSRAAAAQTFDEVINQYTSANDVEFAHRQTQRESKVKKDLDTAMGSKQGIEITPVLIE
jgi:hypothetical protein